MSTRIFVDTLFIIALVNQRDQYHHQALSLADLFENRPLLITDAVLLEIGNALARGYKAEAIAVLDHLLTAEEVEVVRLTPELFEEAFHLFRRYRDKSWGLIDCLSFVAMRRADVSSALTFDPHFVQAGFQALMRENLEP